MADDTEFDAPLIEALKKAADPDKTWTTNAMAKLTVRFKDGTFKKSAIAQGDPPLILTGVRAGKRANVIFEFEPVDVRPYEGIEMDATQAVQMLPGFVGHICAAIGAADAPTFPAACARFRLNVKKRLAQAAEEAKAAEAAKAGQSYVNNPLWGAFA